MFSARVGRADSIGTPRRIHANLFGDAGRSTALDRWPETATTLEHASHNLGLLAVRSKAPQRGAFQRRARFPRGLRRHDLSARQAGAAFPSPPARSELARIVLHARTCPPCSQSGDLSPQ